MRTALKKLLKEELSRRSQERLLAVRGTHVLHRRNGSSVFCDQNFGLNNEVLVPSHMNVLFHEAEVVEAADQQSSTVGSKIKVYILTEVSVEVVLHILGKVYVEQYEVVNMAPGEWTSRGGGI